MKILIFILIFGLFCIKISLCDKSSKMCDLPTECKFLYRDYTRKNEINNQIFTLCENVFDRKMLTRLNYILNNCSLFQQPKSKSLSIFVKESSSKRLQIVNRNFDAFKLERKLASNNNNCFIYLTFMRVKGFDIESTIYLNDGFDRLGFVSEFNLYKKNKIVKSCHDFLGSNSSGFIFKKMDKINKWISRFKVLKIRKNIYPVCLLFFRHARIDYFRIDQMVNSYFFHNFGLI